MRGLSLLIAFVIPLSASAKSNPAITLESIDFVHTVNNAQHPVAIRKNAGHAWPVPEWSRGRKSDANSPVVYSITPANTNVDAGILVQVAFSSSRHQGSFSLRAVSEDQENILGDVAPAKGLFTEHDKLLLRLPNARVRSGKVGIFTVRWNWQMREEGQSEWQPLITTEHKIYLTVAPPTLPWVNSFAENNPNALWTDVLDYSCRWAAGTTNDVDAAAKITQAIYSYGRENNPSDHGVTFSYNYEQRYSDTYRFLPEANELHINRFACDAFTRRINGRVALGPLVNCIDCAASVVTFANALGANLQIVRIAASTPKFDTKPVCVIGSKAPVAFLKTNGFAFHAVAWKGEVNKDGLVFDACVAFPGEKSADSAQLFYPAGLRFGDRQTRDSYIARFAQDPEKLHLSEPQMMLITRPKVYLNDQLLDLKAPRKPRKRSLPKLIQAWF